MAIRLEVISIIPDTRAETRKNSFNVLEIKNKITDVSIVDVYTIDKKIEENNANNLNSLFYNPSVQKTSSSSPLHPKKFSWAIEIGFLPGVTDNIANTSKEMIEDKFKIKFVNDENVYSSQITFITGLLNETDIKKIADSLYNPLIQSVIIKNFRDFVRNKGMGSSIPKVTINAQTKVDEINLNISDDELISIGKQGIQNKDKTRRGPLALDLDQMKVIRDYFKKQKRSPTDVELESIAQTWSEHCKHTIFANPID
jgi:phosphoribosylformylglycinamidine synthase